MTKTTITVIIAPDAKWQKNYKWTGSYTKINREFLLENIGKSFTVTRKNLSYWELPNGFAVHYNDVRTSVKVH